MLSTVKTTFGFLASLLERATPLSFASTSIQGIYNFLPYTEPNISTSGQPSEDELKLIAEAGYQVVLNLAPHGVENALPNEPAVVESLNMQYQHIPVDFKRPTDADFASFTSVLEQNKEHKLWVHCAANMRVSAFVYRYRCTRLGHPVEKAKKSLHKIWQPFGVWKKFLAL